MPEHEAAPSPAGMLGRMDGANSGSRTIFLLEQASLRDICYFLSLSCFPEEAVLAFITPQEPGTALREPRRWGHVQEMRWSDPSLCSSTACPPQMLMRF